MKFATLALVASTSAIRLQEQAQGCVIPPIAVKMAFQHIDTNGNGQLSADELKAAFEFVEKAYDFKIGAKAADWIEGQAKKDAGEGGPKDSMSVKEFGQFANQTVNHFGVCKQVMQAIKDHE